MLQSFIVHDDACLLEKFIELQLAESSGNFGLGWHDFANSIGVKTRFGWFFDNSGRGIVVEAFLQLSLLGLAELCLLLHGCEQNQSELIIQFSILIPYDLINRYIDLIEQISTFFDLIQSIIITSQQTMYESSNPTAKLIISLLCTALIATSQQQSEPPITSLALSQSYSATQSGGSYSYYQLTLNISQKLLLLTLDTNSTSSTNIYISLHYSDSNQTFTTHPDDLNYNQECHQRSFDTCILRFDDQATHPPRQATLYFSIYSNANIKYDILAATEDIYNLNISYSYRIDFSTYQSGVLRITGDQFQIREEVVLVLSYNTSGLVGQFKVEAAVDQIPKTQGCCSSSVYASSVGAFNKIMKLKPISANQSYYLLIEGEKGTKFDLHFIDSTPSAPTIPINSSVIYQTGHNLTYLSHTSFANSDLPLFIRLDAYSGYGIFSVNYCNGYFQTTFQNINGQNGQICISPDQRKQCKKHMSKAGQFGLLVQNIEIEVLNVMYHFGYQIGVYQGVYDSSLRINEGKYGIFLNNEANRSYPIEVIQLWEVSVQYQQLTITNSGVLFFEIDECFKRRNVIKCNTISNSQNNTSGNLTFKPVLDHTYTLNISCIGCANTTDKIEYLVEMSYQQEQNSNLQPYKLYLQEVQENQYQFYVINFTQIADELKIILKNYTLLTINFKELNGDIYLLSSLTIPQPTFEKYITANTTSDIIFSWNGVITYQLNQTDKLVYLGVKGNEQSLYYLQYAIDVDADIPAKYTKLIEGVQNSYILNKTNPYQLLSFSSHIIPFKMYITNTPKCIRMGHSLPLDQTCLTQIPTTFSKKVVYLNISHGTNPNNFKFGVFVNSGEYVLNDRQPILVGCIDTCYQLISVQLLKASNVIHQGRGNIFQVSNTSNIAYNSFLPLKCELYPCSIQVNASLPYGGEMSLFLQSSGIRQIEWMSTPITFGDYPKKFIYDLRSWSDFNTILIYSQALQLDAYYNIINIQKNDSNTKKYKFPTPQSNDGWQIGNPLRKVHIVTINQYMVASKGCRRPNNHCIVALSLYPNLTIEYNQDYFDSGIGYISANTYQYYFPLNMPYEINQDFSMSYFAHKTSIQEYSMGGYRISLQPISNCHPLLYTIPYFTNPTFQKPSYDSMIVQPYQEWINFTVIAQDDCRYRVTLSNSTYESVIQNKFYHMSTTSQMVKFLFRSEYARKLGYKIELQTDSLYSRVNYIAVKKVKENLPYVEPTPTNNDFISTNSSTLEVPQNETYDLYLICISTNSSTVQLIIRKDEPVVLTHNEQDRQNLASSQLLSYRIHVSGSVALFVTTNRQYSMVTINKNYNQTLVKHAVISSRSDPWIYINATNKELTTYDITIRNGGNESAYIVIMFQLNDVLSYRRIYQGIIAYDAFISKQQKNCYYFETPLLVGRKDIVVDFIMGKNDSLFIDYCQNQSHTDPNNPCFKLMYSVSAESTIIKTIFSALQTTPPIYRLRFPFVPKENYTLCFYTSTLNVTNIEYYVLLNDPSMQHLIEDTLTTKFNPNQYDMYEIVEEGYNQNIMIELSSCITNPANEKTIVGSASFIDSSLGRYTDLVDYYKTKDTIYAKLSVRQGYYYIGIKNKLYQQQYANAYTIRFQNITNYATLMPTKWELPDTKIVKIYNSDSSKSNFTVELPELVSIDNDTSQNNLSFTYTIYISNATNKNDQNLPLDLIGRCPSYNQQNLQNSKAETNLHAVKSINFSYDNLTYYLNKKQSPRFTFKAEQLPKEFNISGRIDMSSNSQSFSFYYESNDINLNHSGDPSGSSNGFVIMILILVAAMITLGGYVAWKFFGKKQEKNNSVEMTSMKESEQKRSQATPKVISGKGYGELVDQLT